MCDKIIKLNNEEKEKPVYEVKSENELLEVLKF